MKKFTGKFIKSENKIDMEWFDAEGYDVDVLKKFIICIKPKFVDMEEGTWKNSETTLVAIVSKMINIEAISFLLDMTPFNFECFRIDNKNVLLCMRYTP